MAVDTKEKILIAALELFSARGRVAVGTKAIAEAAGVNEVTLFRTFGTKDRLWVEVFQRFVVLPEPEFLLKGATGSLAEDLDLAVHQSIELLKANTKLVRMGMMDKGQFPEIDAELDSQPTRMILILTAHLEPHWSGLKASPEVVARTLVDTLFGVVIHFEVFHEGPESTLDRWVAEFLPLFLGGCLQTQQPVVAISRAT